MRVGVVDIGSNSTRLLIAEIAADGRIVELDRRSQVTRLAEGVDANGRLAPDAIARVEATLTAYRVALDGAQVAADARVAVLTSAVRDAADGDAFTAAVRERHGLRARTLSGDDEARLTFLGAIHGRADAATGPVLVCDIGGGSTELVVGDRGAVEVHASLRLGVVRQTERHIAHDPPRPDELQALADEARTLLDEAIADMGRPRPTRAIGVAGTATSLAAITQELEPYDPRRVHGYRIARAQIELQLARLAQMPLAERRAVRGLHPDRAPVIVAGTVILLEIVRAFDCDELEISERDLMHGVALERAGVA